MQKIRLMKKLGFLTLAVTLPLQVVAQGAATTVTLNSVVSETSSYVAGQAVRGTDLPTAITQPTTGTGALTTVGAQIHFDEKTMMRPRELRPGMKGYGLSVFSGLRPERFEVEIIGVRHNAFPNEDMILCKVITPHVQEIGVVAGMSGSPIYVNDRLVGAIAYGWLFSREPLAGVTPIESMLRVFNSTSSSREPAERAGGSFRAYERYQQMRLSLKAERLDWLNGANSVRVAGLERQSGATGELEMQPLATPLLVSSSSPATIRLMNQLFAGSNIEALAAGSISGGPNSATSEAAPGGSIADLNEFAKEIGGGYALAVPLIEGDMNVAGVGTITYRNGDKLVAFGHPMFGMGVVSYPMAPARINEIVRSVMRPFKIGESVGQVGVVHQDRFPAIGGVIGGKAPMFSVHARIDDANYLGYREYNYRIWNDKDMGPSFAMIALTESVGYAARSGGDTATAFSYSVQLDDGTEFTKEDYFVDESGGMMAAVAAGSDIGVLATNPYKKVLPKHLSFTMKVRDRLPQANIHSLELNQASFRPGETVHMTCHLRPYRGEPQTVGFSFRLPVNLLDGEYELSVADARRRQRIDSSRDPGSSRIDNYESLLREVRENYPQNKLYVTLADKDTGVNVSGMELPKLPASIINTIESTTPDAEFAPVRGNLLVDADVTTEYEISGSKQLDVKVQRQEK